MTKPTTWQFNLILCQDVITMSYLHSKCHYWAKDTVINMHKPYFMLKTYVMSWLWRCHVSLMHTPSSKVLPKWSLWQFCITNLKVMYFNGLFQTHSQSVYIFGEINLAYCLYVFNWDRSKITHVILKYVSFQIGALTTIIHFKWIQLNAVGIVDAVLLRINIVLSFSMPLLKPVNVTWAGEWIVPQNSVQKKNRFLMLTSCFQAK